jgi:hypothetical protein
MQPEMLPGPVRMQPGTPPRQTQMQPGTLPKRLQMQPGITRYAREACKFQTKDALKADKVKAKHAQEDVADAPDIYTPKLHNQVARP